MVIDLQLVALIMKCFLVEHSKLCKALAETQFQQLYVAWFSASFHLLDKNPSFFVLTGSV